MIITDLQDLGTAAKARVCAQATVIAIHQRNVGKEELENADLEKLELAMRVWALADERESV